MFEVRVAVGVGDSDNGQVYVRIERRETVVHISEHPLSAVQLSQSTAARLLSDIADEARTQLEQLEVEVGKEVS